MKKLKFTLIILFLSFSMFSFTSSISFANKLIFKNPKVFIGTLITDSCNGKVEAACGGVCHKLYDNGDGTQTQVNGNCEPLYTINDEYYECECVNASPDSFELDLLAN